MNAGDNLFEQFLKEDCDQHARSVLLSTIGAAEPSGRVVCFTFNRFNVRLDFGRNEAVVDDEINPEDGECTVALEVFRDRIAGM